MSEAEEIATAVVEALETSRKIDNDTHAKHHEYLETLIINNTKKAEAWSQIRMHVAKFGALGFITFVGWAVWHYFTELVSNGIHPQ